ncbi:sodium-extruding oxaloacetate decarboxylase subunit alpha [Methanimicrococcus blatticola]|uniref:Pyruvate carboxylase subunit B n=1 Tax=Methanimicrococcus blatticola TaxID=91560 RepID=A0A484F4Q0_9EURY|nr:sodium-extruding oxaloacetate decarboxylase subunit alpha [Methanimicrococcus blatticola]MBZ3935719.1 sodium-extruding oxaloacetate decarboxylase subunit alpha [Methanimicrococcus blatticola]MCC2508161.1 sodium-extruding oxaloacetate decarboxylase subunit alpha [Methanimicrococcus blatticola]TDQ68762.1 pyruvate carboxylase subunit B [Methanimicrococcus blatticola]
MAVKITETALRDAHQSLIATRMRTRDILDIVEQLDDVGYWSLEMWGGATFDTSIRYLNEDPWQRLRDIKSRMKKTPAQMLLRGQNLVGYRHYSDDVVEKFVTKAHENGIDIFRIFDALNDFRNIETSVRTAKKVGAHVQGTVSYTISPVHTPETFIKMAKQLEEMDCDSICIKDMAGLLSPAAASEIVSGMKKEVSIPICVHSHCTSGMAPVMYYAAVEAGADIIDTAISPFGWGSSQPPTEAMVASLMGTKYDTGISLEKFNEITPFFRNLKDKYNSICDPISETIDANVILYQIPGGMLSNLVSQLKEQNALDKYMDVLAEMPRVREELGYPPLVTPTSQIVGTQAVLNVIMGERYKVIPKEVKDYARGYYGKTPVPMSPEMISLIIGDEQPITVRPGDQIPPEYEKMKKEAEEMGIAKSEEDVLTYILYPAIAPKFLKGEAEEEELVCGCSIPSSGSVNTAGIPTEYRVEVDGSVFDVKVEPTGYSIVAADGGNAGSKAAPAADEKKSKADLPGAVVSSMQGMILSIKTKVGEQVNEGDTICVIEAMKMENAVSAPKSGVVKEIIVAEGDTVTGGDALMIIE